MNRRVVVTGTGCVTPLGNDVQQAWQFLLAGQSGVGPITLFDASTFPVQIAAEVSDWNMSDAGEDPRDWDKYARQTQFAVVAASDACQHAGLPNESMDPIRLGVLLGCGEIFPDFDAFARLTGHALSAGQLSLDEFIQQASQTGFGVDELYYEPGVAASLIAARLDAQGPTANFTSACVSSSKAIGEALEMIRRDEADVMLTGGTHSMIHPFGITGFHRLSTLSTRNDDPPRASRPFERDRDGFVVGEGGAILVLEELDHALRRGADIYAELSGYSCTHDAYRITDLEPNGRSAARAIQQSLNDAHLTADDINYINAHGSGTVLNDRVETLAVKKALGNTAYRIPMSSTKCMTGHLTTACGAIETLVSVLAVHTSAVPPTINYENPDKDCDLDYVPNTAREIDCRHVMTNNFGFGGQNVSLIVSQYTGA
jgi:3-oxoacyl-[acyl-carrier-protein] synthase II